MIAEPEIENEVVRGLVEKFLEKYKKPETRKGYRNVVKNVFLKELGNRNIDTDFMIKFRDKWQFEPYGKIIFTRLKTFLRYVADHREEQSALINSWIDMLKWQGKSEKKFYAEITRNLDWLREIIDAVLKLNVKKDRLANAFAKFRFTIAMLLQATTGMRPYELKNLTWKIFEEVPRGEPEDFRERNYFILPPRISKTPFSRVQPLSDEVKWILSEYREIYKKHYKRLQLKTDELFPYRESRKVIDALKKADVDFTQEDLRDFATTMATAVLKVPGALEASIAGHQTDKWRLEIDSYIQLKPSDLADLYLQYWNFEILTQNQRKAVEALISEIEAIA